MLIVGNFIHTNNKCDVEAKYGIFTLRKPNTQLDRLVKILEKEYSIRSSSGK